MSQGQQTEGLGSVAVHVEGIEPADREGTIALVEQDLDRFNDFLVKQGGGHPLARAEKAILKTYLLYKHQGAF